MITIKSAHLIKIAGWISFLLFTPASGVYGRKCHCEREGWTEFNRTMKCRPIRFQNSASLYWQYNCDSSWLTFKSNQNKTKIIFSLGMVDYIGRIGYDYVFENKRSFTIVNRIISGCCAPLEYVLFEKETGKEIRNFGPCIWYSQNKQYNFLVYFADSAYNKISLYFIDSKRRLTLSIPKGRFHDIDNAVGRPELLFYNEKIANGIFTILYRYKTTSSSDVWKTDSLRVDLINGRAGPSAQLKDISNNSFAGQSPAFINH